MDHEIRKVLVEGFVERGMKIEKSKLTGLNIKKVGGKFIVTRQHQDGKVYENEEYDQVFNCWARVCKTDKLGLEHRPGVSVSQGSSQTIIGGNQGIIEMTGDDRVFAIGDVLRGSARNNPAAEIGGKRVANMIKELLDLQKSTSNDAQTIAQRKESVYSKYRSFSYSPMPITVFTSPSASAVGLTEEEAVAQYGKDNVHCVTLKRLALLDDFAGDRKAINSYKIVSLKTNGKVLGLHYVGDEGEEIIYGLSVAMRQGLTLQALQDSFFIHPSRSEVFWKASDATESYTIESC